MITTTTPPTAATMERLTPFVASSMNANIFGMDAPPSVLSTRLSPNQDATKANRKPRGCGPPGMVSGSTAPTGVSGAGVVIGSRVSLGSTVLWDIVVSLGGL